jgi:diguanylate cyclase (GGDEF)-like protein/PAS domain S-box-containing protein
VEVVVVDGHGDSDEIAGDGLTLPLARRSLCLPWEVFAGAQDPAVLLESSRKGLCVAQVNDAFLSLSGQSRDDVIGADMDVLFAEAVHADEVRSLWRQLGSEPVRIEAPLLTVSAMRVPVEVELIPLLNADRECCLVILRDLSERHNAVAHAERADQRLRLATDVGRIGTWEWKPASAELAWDRWLRVILGVSDAERASHARWTELVHPLDRERAAADAQLLLAGALDEVEARYRIARPDGTAGQVLARTRVSERDERGVATCLIGVLLDISELHQAAEEREILLAAEKQARQAAESASQELARLASSDPLTGLANRHELNRWMNQALSSNERFVVMFFDLDGFKPVNDSHGHSVGDRVLIELARRLRIQVRAADLVARFGGDEFVVATVVATADEAAGLAQRLLHDVAQPVVALGVRVTLTASVGLALSDHTTDPERLLGDADLALYHAKNQGRNRAVWFHPTHRDLVVS